MRAERQAGVVLISVLLVMALTLMIVAGMLRSHQVAVSGVARQLSQLQHWQLALAGEAIAREHLDQDRPAASASTHLGQAWNRVHRFQHEGAEVRITLHDLGGRFNLAMLTRDGQVDALALQRWQRLRESLAIEGVAAEQLQGLSLISLDQLRALPGVDRPLLQRLRPWVALLPAGVGLNVNTLSAPLLARLEGLPVAALAPLFQRRPAQGWASVQAFAAEPEVQRLGIATQGLAVTSHWFAAYIEVRAVGQVMYLTSELWREPRSGRISVVRRTLSSLGETDP